MSRWCDNANNNANNNTNVNNIANNSNNNGNAVNDATPWYSNWYSKRWVQIGLLAIVVLIGVAGFLLLLPAVRKLIRERVQPILAEVGPRLLTIAQRPAKLAEGIGGIILLNAAFAACMIASCEAFGAGRANYPAIALVYLAGSTIGQASPTPGGLGAVEAAYVAGLTAAGLDPGVALSATLLFRLLTFWLPTIPGYWSFNRLQKIGAL